MSATSDEANDLTADLIKKFGVDVASLGGFEPEMVCLEGLVAGLIAFNAYRYNRHPDQMVEAFCDGLRERVDRLIYGAKQ